jgi:SPP1 family holin
MKKKIEAGTIARTVVLIFALINQVLTMAGWNPLPFSEDEVYQVVTGILTVGAALTAWWKNNSFTQAAIVADEQLHMKK